MRHRKNQEAWKQALIDQHFTEIVIVVGEMKGKDLLTDTYRVVPGVGRTLTIDDIEAFVAPGKICLAYRAMGIHGIGFFNFNPYLTDEVRSYAHELINKNYPLEDHTEHRVTDDGHVIVDLDELDEIKPQSGGVN